MHAAFRTGGIIRAGFLLDSHLWSARCAPRTGLVSHPRQKATSDDAPDSANIRRSRDKCRAVRTRSRARARLHSLIGGDDTTKIHTYGTCVPPSPFPHSSNVWQKERVRLMQTEYLAKPDRPTQLSRHIVEADSREGGEGKRHEACRGESPYCGTHTCMWKKVLNLGIVSPVRSLLFIH